MDEGNKEEKLGAWGPCKQFPQQVFTETYYAPGTRLGAPGATAGIDSH